MVGTQRIVQQVRPFHIAGGVKALHTSQLFCPAHAFFGQVAGVFLLLDFKVHIAAQLFGDGVGFGVLVQIVVGRTGDNQRCSCFINPDVVDLVDNGVIQWALYLQPLVGFHVVTQVVESKLVAGSVGDVTRVVFLSLLRSHLGLDGSDGQAQVEMNGAHPFHITASEIVVHRDHVHFAGECVEERGQCGNERLSFPGDHFGDHPVVQDVSADDLHVVVTHLQEPTS